MTYLDNRSDELEQEVGQSEERGEPVVEEVDDESLDVRSVVILHGVVINQ